MFRKSPSSSSHKLLVSITARCVMDSPALARCSCCTVTAGLVERRWGRSGCSGPQSGPPDPQRCNVAGQRSPSCFQQVRWCRSRQHAGPVEEQDTVRRNWGATMILTLTQPIETFHSEKQRFFSLFSQTEKIIWMLFYQSLNQCYTYVVHVGPRP